MNCCGRSNTDIGPVTVYARTWKRYLTICTRNYPPKNRRLRDLEQASLALQFCEKMGHVGVTETDGVKRQVLPLFSSKDHYFGLPLEVHEE